jgi:hypothetical protein
MSCSADEVGGRKVGVMSAQGHIVDLADAIEALRAELTEAIDRGRSQGMQFRVEPIELTLQAVVTKDANGKIGWGALGVGASYESASTQTLKLQLQPVWRMRDGSLVTDFTVTDQSAVPQHFGPRPLPETAQRPDG